MIESSLRQSEHKKLWIGTKSDHRGSNSWPNIETAWKTGMKYEWTFTNTLTAYAATLNS